MRPPQRTTQWPHYHTPVRIDLLEPYLDAHPDRLYATYMAEGLRHGFRIGFTYRSAQIDQSRRTHHPSCNENPQVVSERIQAEVQAGRLLGPLPPNSLPMVHVSPLGLVPKSHQPNKFRLIVDLSSPVGRSVNDGIPSEPCSLKYASVDDAVSIVKALGKGSLLVKIDLKDAYRMIPVHPDDYHLLGVTWAGQTYVDRALPFGLRSAPKIFTAFADLIAWILHQHGIAYQVHYLDDFLFFGAPLAEEAAAALETVVGILHALGIPIATHKTEGPTTSLIFLGILVDTCTFELRLPVDKLTRLQIKLDTWTTRKHCQKHELESLLGHLSHAATVVRHGRTFLRQLFTLLSRAHRSRHFIHLTAGAKADLLWWKVFLQVWNGLSFFPRTAATSVEVTSDASGSFGCGAFSPHHGWFQLTWPESWTSTNIAAKELVPIVLAASLWGPYWHREGVCFRSDNMAVVDVLCSRTARDPLLMHLLRCLVFYAAIYQFDFRAEHLPGSHNMAADALSRNNLTLFSSLVPQMQQVAIPQPARDLLVETTPNWGSHEWTILFRNSLNRGSPRPPLQCTGQAGATTSNSAAPLPTPHSHSPRIPSAGLQP